LASELDFGGELRAGLSIREATFERDPLHAPTFGNLQQSYAIMGQTEKALEMLDGLQAYLPGDASLTGNYGQVYRMSGQLAESSKKMKDAYDKEPLNAVHQAWYAFALQGAKQYDLMAQIAPKSIAPLALVKLGKIEEALILSNEIIGEGQNPVFAFRAMVESGRFEVLIKTLESHWSNLDDFTRNWPGRGGYGDNAMAFIAHAYRQLGNQTKFADAMSRLRASLDAQLAEGANNWVLSISQAYYAVLADDFDAAIVLLEQAFQQGAYMDTENEYSWPIFKPLNGDPRYEAAKAAMNARLDEELEKMEQGI
jgi:hypothetical protein